MLRSIAGALVAVLLVGCGGQKAVSISGAGSTFAAPIFSKWAESYRAETGTALNYQAVGSGGGIRQVVAKTVAFGATDKPLQLAELEETGLIQFPAIMGGVVPIVNLPGVLPGQMKITGPLLAAIYLGEIKTWNDPRITALNPGVALPNLPITVVHRSDGSGTTFQLTSYLAMKSPDWLSKVGANDAVAWPLGIGGKGNDGVSAFVKQTLGSIGYVEYAYAKQNNASHVLVENRDGQYPLPEAANFTAAAAGADWANAPGNYMLLLDQPGPDAWPITAATFVLLHRSQSRPEVAAAVLRFFDWSFSNGDASAGELDYVPMPDTVKAMVREQWAAVTGPDGQPVYTAD